LQKKVDLSGLSICFIAGTLGMGGAERQLFYIVRSLKQQGARVSVLSLRTGEFWERQILELGIGVVWVGSKPSRIARLTRMVAELSRLRPHIIQSQHFFTNLYAVTAGRFLGIPSIAAIRSDVTFELAANGRLLGGLSLRLPRLIAANSRIGIEAAQEHGVSATRLQFIPNVVDTTQFCPRIADLLPAGHVRILAVGRLTQEKRVDRLLEIISRVRELASSPFEVQIVGAGPLRSTLEERAEQLGLRGIVEFKGAVSDMAAVYRSAHILAHAPDHEGTPNVLMEAMASGLAVVATNLGGVGDLMRHRDSGFLFSPGEDDDMARNLAMLVDNPDLRRQVGERARTSIEQTHSLHVLPRALSELYSKALAS
jgi:glycosyltransferase involved in cell wall biosynthesis